MVDVLDCKPHELIGRHDLAKGSVVVADAQTHTIEPFPVTVRDTTGAGDLYAAGFLHGLAQDWSLDRCGRLGSDAAAHIITCRGARPDNSLAPLIQLTRTARE